MCIDNDGSGVDNITEIGVQTQPGWTEGPFNTHYSRTGTVDGNLPPDDIGPLDPDGTEPPPPEPPLPPDDAADLPPGQLVRRTIVVKPGQSIQAAIDWIKGLTDEPEEGMIYKGKVVKVMDFGAFVNFFGPKDGLVHVSQMKQERVNHPSDVVSEGDEVFVKLLGFDDRGKVRLSMKVVDQESGKELAKEEAAAEA